MIFSLDVGTRTLVGVIADYDENENLIIKHTSIREHESRAMVDGQIHDVQKVAKGVTKVKKELEEKLGEKLEDVAVALAGRFLITTTGEHIADISSTRYIDNSLVKTFEIEAVKDATQKLNENNGMYCVGYSVLYYELDDEWIKRLEGQRGTKASVKVIAAFLPKNVVEAMISVLELNDLKPAHITLEPIAAINLVVPEDLRNLNIVMVDVGAGTSDIAVSNEGTIVGYGMVPMAGDEITDSITKKLLIDFKAAEEIKKHLHEKEKFIYKDILDFEQEITKKEVLEIIEPVINNITTNIADRILELNGKPPVAVMVVGGGGKVPGFKEKLGEKLGLPKNRIALKDLKSLNTIKFEGEKELVGSEFITPVGIANVALKNEGNVFTSVYINGKTVNMMMVGTNLTVLQVLLQDGYSLSQLIGKPSPAITYEVNGELTIKKGNMGKEAPISVNDRPASLKTKINSGDRITIGTPKDGEPLILKVKDVINPIKYFLNGKPQKIYPKIIVNNKESNIDTIIKDGDKITLEKIYLKNVTNSSNKTIYFTIDGIPYEIPSNTVILKNGEVLKDDYEIKNMDSFEIEKVDLPVIGDFIDVDVKKRAIDFNGKTIFLPEEECLIKVGNKIIDKNKKISEGENYIIEKIEKNPTIIDLLAHLSIDTRTITSFEIYINGKKVESFMQTLPPNSSVRFNYK
ncbi:cell division protein FtsA [Tepiditoga spiralis]|uniref:Cell division protein FtsA n=1 Tax=Tepiditoga spiralis TaxID=2108365 RepID=A0A7G1G9F6_9BACT|nr:cell division FtsA domain-containing protein [Tepiditoga spiralis]BBE31854.1 cell division protein FtsA [Tepiditoga spiralis]